MARFFLHVLAAAAVMAFAGAMMENSAQALSEAMKHMVPSDFAYKPPASNEVTVFEVFELGTPGLRASRHANYCLHHCEPKGYFCSPLARFTFRLSVQRQV